MKSQLVALLSTLAMALAAFGHGGMWIGPNGGRILIFSTDATTLGEVIVQDGKFQIEVLDKDMKPVPLAAQELTVTRGVREKPEKLAVEKKDGKYFVAPTVEFAEWVIFQFKENATAKPFTARLLYAGVSANGKTPDGIDTH